MAVVLDSLLVQQQQIERVQVVLQDQLTKIPVHMTVLLVKLVLLNAVLVQNL